VIDTAEDIGSKLFDKAKSFADKATEQAESLFDKAQEEAAKESMDDVIKKAQQANADLENKVKKADETFAERMGKEDGLGKHESFFDKAARYADGDYSAEGQNIEGEMEIKQNPDYKPAEKKKGNVPGFEDLDGDGNEIIDDAILED
jgi:polyhydroxyalkanoate synthesis regulator phasin